MKTFGDILLGKVFQYQGLKWFKMPENKAICVSFGHERFAEILTFTDEEEILEVNGEQFVIMVNEENLTDK
jgi:hypothetical protein